MGVELEVLHVGDVPTPKPWIFGAQGRFGLAELVMKRGDTITIPLLAWLIRHPDAGPIVVDTGLHPDAARSVSDDYGRVNGLLFGALHASPRGFADQLGDLGVDPAEVQLAVMTHLHADHTSGMRLLPNAEFAITREEWAAASGRGAVLGGYVSSHLPPASRVRQINFRHGTGHGHFARTIDLLGDGSVRLLSTPGHSPGHMSLLVQTADQGEVLIVGDAVYTLKSLREQIKPFRMASERRYLDSVRQLRAYAAANPDATLVPTHDPDAWRMVAERGRVTAS
jgi:N-acyl homoserine lactone hydrolase